MRVTLQHAAHRISNSKQPEYIIGGEEIIPLLKHLVNRPWSNIAVIPLHLVEALQGAPPGNVTMFEPMHRPVAPHTLFHIPFDKSGQLDIMLSQLDPDMVLIDSEGRRKTVQQILIDDGDLDPGLYSLRYRGDQIEILDLHGLVVFTGLES